MYGDYKIKPLPIMLPKTSAYAGLIQHWDNKIYWNIAKKSLKILLSTQKYHCFVQLPDIKVK